MDEWSLLWLFGNYVEVAEIVPIESKQKYTIHIVYCLSQIESHIEKGSKKIHDTDGTRTDAHC